MNRAGKIALGCLLAPIGLVVVGVFFFMAMRMAGVPEPQATSRNLHQPVRSAEERVASPGQLESRRIEPADPGSEVISIPKDQVLRVVIDLEEGEFDILPGPQEEGIRVSADYDEASYELTQKYDVDGDGTPTYFLRFRSKVSLLRRIAQDGAFDDEDIGANLIEVQLPLDTPMELALSLAKAEGDVDLSGLSLQTAATKFRMGEFRLQSFEDNPIPMRAFTAQCTMGEFDLRGISALRPAVIRAEASMGELSLDLGGSLANDTEVIARLRMGSMTLNLPDDAFWDPTSRAKASWGEVQGSLENRGSGDPETSPRLRVDASVFMGEMVIDSYRSRGSLRRSRRR